LLNGPIVLPHDTYGRDWGLYIAERLPFILGANVAGTIVSLGTANTGDFQPGDRVFGLSNFRTAQPDQQGLQQFAVLSVDAISKSPDGLSDEQVVTIPVNLVTSAIALFTKDGFGFPAPYATRNKDKDADSAAESVVIIGGGANVGKFAVQLAKIAGVGKVVVVAGASNRDALMKMGATHVVDRSLPFDKLVDSIHGILGKDGATHIYDCANMEFSLASALLPVNEKSKLVTLLPLDAFDKTKSPNCEAIMLDASNECLAPDQKSFWASTSSWLEEGRVLPTDFRIIEGLEDVDGINEALDGYADFGRSGQKGVVVKIA
jgi:NADPH:quinone reductase